MPLAPCIIEFQSLATHPHSHVRIGDLAQIHLPGVNAAVGTRTFSSEAQSIIDAVDVTEMAKPYMTPASHLRAYLPGCVNVSRHDLMGSVSGVLERILPPHTRYEALAHDLALMLGDISDAYQGQPGFSGAMDYGMQARLAGTRGYFHRDIDVLHRGFIVVKGKGTWTADNSVRQQFALIDADPLRERETGPNHNNYGRPSEELAHLLRRAPSGRPMIWHGELANAPAPGTTTEAERLEQATPLIHSEDDVATTADARWTIVATPSEMKSMAGRMVTRRMVFF